jgi:predicted phage terminase large subunit-like protein
MPPIVLKDWKTERKEPGMIQVMQEMCLNSFKMFCLAVFEFHYKKKFIWAEPHDKMNEALMRAWAGLDRNLIINVAPRYGKTSMLCLFAAWTYAHNARCEYLHLSYSDDLAVRNSDKIRTIIKSEFFRDLFGVEIDAENDRKGEWRTTAGGLFKATATGGQVTGFGAGATTEFDDHGRFVFSGALLIDDPLKPSDAHTTRREQVNTHWYETIKSRRNSPDTTPTICIMQRIHAQDFTTCLMDDASENFSLLKLTTLRDDGSALWPQKHSPSVLAQMREANIYVFSAQYQQEPAPAGGSVFQETWWGWYTEMPVFDKVIITADTAQKTKEHNDYSVLQAWGFWGAHNRVYLIDQVRGKWEAPDLKRVAVAFISSVRSRYILNGVYVEDKASGTGLIQELARETTTAIIPLQRNRDKVSRSFDAAPHVQARQCFLPEGKSFSDEFVTELSAFSGEMKHAHDDICDCFFDAVEILLGVVEPSMWDVVGDINVFSRRGQM